MQSNQIKLQTQKIFKDKVRYPIWQILLPNSNFKNQSADEVIKFHDRLNGEVAQLVGELGMHENHHMRHTSQRQICTILAWKSALDSEESCPKQRGNRPRLVCKNLH